MMKESRLISKGFTFLEILFAMVFFLVIIASFAMVFPSGYHLNLKTYRQNQGVNLADAILQEVASKPFYSPPGSAIGDSLANLAGWRGVGDWTPLALTTFWRNNPALLRQFGYTLLPTASPFPGIRVSCVEPGCFNPALLNDNPLVQVTVNLSWTDNTNGFRPLRVITLTTYVTYDR